jgi:UDP-2,3-diacylglucosamine pyrophosphatase LpxH
MSDGPLVVVSDIHLGILPPSVTAFPHFLEWLTTLQTIEEGVTIETRNGNKCLKAPQQIILLGDILDLWEPRGGDLIGPLRDSFDVFKLLFGLNCEKIYVTGNHDEMVRSYSGTYTCGNGTRFTVVPKHYPEKTSQWIKVGDTTYFFLHGHQFNKVFKHGGVLKFVNLMGQLSLAYHGVDPRLGWGGFVLLLLSLFFLISPLFITWPNLLLQWPLVYEIPLLLIWVFFGVVGCAWIWRQLQKAWGTVHPNSQHPTRRMRPSATERLISSAKYVAGSAQHIDIDSLVDKHYYKRSKDTIAADVIVFGHTHIPGIRSDIISPAVKKTLKKMFVNSGSWLDSWARVLGVPYNTLVYIDGEGPILLQWDDKKRTVHQLTQSAKGEGLKKTRWQFWKRQAASQT